MWRPSSVREPNAFEDHQVWARSGTKQCEGVALAIQPMMWGILNPTLTEAPFLPASLWVLASMINNIFSVSHLLCHIYSWTTQGKRSQDGGQLLSSPELSLSEQGALWQTWCVLWTLGMIKTQWVSGFFPMTCSNLATHCFHVDEYFLQVGEEQAWT